MSDMNNEKRQGTSGFFKCQALSYPKTESHESVWKEKTE
jgi:hypothetical protein